jgi:hypothetical protein
MIKRLIELWKEERIDVRILKRKADWVVYSATTPEQVAAAQAYYRLYEALLERWHGNAFITAFALPAAGFGLILAIILACVSVKWFNEILK